MVKNNDVESIAYDILKQSKSLGVFPTPVDRIVQYSELVVDSSIDLSVIPQNYFSKSIESLKRALRKTRGALDRRKKKIYLDLTQGESRKNFIKLHEVGHEVLPWQRELYEFFEDDELSINIDTQDEFEFEANCFASSALFQLDRYKEEMDKLPLEIGSPMALAKKFGSSQHASIRKYVDTSNKRCALLVLEKETNGKLMGCEVRNYFQSSSFTKTFGNVIWEKNLSIKWPFVQDVYMRRRFHTEGQVAFNTKDKKLTTFTYHYFNNTFNTFVLIIPVGEKNYSRTSFYFKENL